MLAAIILLHLASTAWGQTAPVNDLFTNAMLISGPIATITASNFGATKEPREPDHAGNVGGASVWWRWTSPTNGTVTIDTVGSSFDTLLAVCKGASISSFTVASNDDWGGFSASRVSFSAVARTNYLIAVDGFAGASGDILLNLRMGPAFPLITNQPQSRVSVRGGSATFQVKAAGTPPLYYQWYLNGTNIFGATNASYTLSNVQATNAGNYSVVVTNIAGGATSSNAVLWINDIVITITSQPQSLTLAAGYDATFSIGAVGKAPLSYQWQKGGLDIPGAIEARYSITNLQITNTGAYGVVISGAGSLTSSVAMLTVIYPYTFVTFAGLTGVSGTNDGVGSAARFSLPHGIAVDRADNVYITDMANNTIRKLTPAGVVTTVAGTPRHAGTSDGPFATARFSGPWALTLDQQTNIYVADTDNYRIRKITPDGTVTTLSEMPGGAALFFDTPSGVVMNNEGALYVSEFGGHTLRKLTPNSTNWVVTTVAGQHLIFEFGYVDGKGLGVRFNLPGALAMDRVRNILYIADERNNAIRKMAPEGLFSTMAGGRSGWGDGTGGTAGFNGPHGPSVDRAGNVYVADMDNCNVRRVTPDGVVTTLGGPASVYRYGAVDGTGRNTRFFYPRGVAVDSLGNLYVTDFLNQTIRKGVPFAITTWPQGQVVLAGTPVTLSVAAAGDNGPFSYHWLLNSVPLAGQTNTTLQLGPVVRTNSGVYSVVVSNAVGNWITIGATVRALVAPVLQAPLVMTNGTMRLLFQDADGGVPYDLSKVTLQWRTNLPSGSDTNWISLASACYLTNGCAAINDTSADSLTSRFYRITVR